ncbi:Amine sulfotransferase-like protein [Leptotrombidium deliense]|uniref:Amine sulfotransferase-like protein n=1 Tax=Leptotrombidium deliense TaxID=299467 RepID=A0A443SPX9_9ACAR|nr:Amine sulfotransferase-like protein [Leptotrombidium deliense]
MNCERFTLPLKYVDGLCYPDYFIDKNIRETVNWKPDDGDVIVSTYPKCGTTWVQAIVWMIQNNGEGSLPRFNDMMIKLTPFMESIGIDAAKALPSPRHLKSHLPFNLIPKNRNAKYITVVRNPKDVCVSFHHFCRELFHIHDVHSCTFDQFFEEFIKGAVPYGDYFDHILSWYKHKNDENVLFLVYEQMKKNHYEAVMRIAKFLSSKEIDYEKLLTNDPNLLKTIVEKTTFDAMKNLPVNDPSEFTDPKNVGDCGNLIKFYRKGIVGDWVTCFNAEQNNRMDNLIKQKFGDIVNEFGWN